MCIRDSYLRVFNPILFDPVEPRSKVSISPISSQREKSKTIKDFFPSIKPDTQGFDFMKKEIERTKQQQKEGKMSLNKFDFFKTNLKDDDKNSCSNFELKGRSSVPKMITPDLALMSLTQKKGESSWTKKSEIMNEKIIEDWESFNNATPNKHIEGENMLKFQSQDMKLTPAKFSSNRSFLALSLIHI